MKSFWIYILASNRNGTLYIGVTSDIAGRIYLHKKKILDGFTKKYDVDKLVYAEECGDANTAHAREKKLKKWNRQWKIALIERMNPEWKDLYEEIK